MTTNKTEMTTSAEGEVWAIQEILTGVDNDSSSISLLDMGKLRSLNPDLADTLERQEHPDLGISYDDAETIEAAMVDPPQMVTKIFYIYFE